MRSGDCSYDSLAAGDALVAAVREECALGVAARAAVDLVDPRDAGVGERTDGGGAQVEVPCREDVAAEASGERRRDLVADLVAAASDGRTDGGRDLAAECRDRVRDNASEEPAPAGVDDRDRGRASDPHDGD